MKPWMAKGLTLASIIFGIAQRLFGGKAQWPLLRTPGPCQFHASSPFP